MSLDHALEIQTEVVIEPSSAPAILTPDSIVPMLLERRKFQVMKFRTTCTDCVPNL